MNKKTKVVKKQRRKNQRRRMLRHRKKLMELRRQLAKSRHAQEIIIVAPPPSLHEHRIDHSFRLKSGRSGHFSAIVNIENEQICTLCIRQSNGVPIFHDTQDHVHVRAMLESWDFKHRRTNKVLIKYLSYKRSDEEVIIAWLDWLRPEMKRINKLVKDRKAQVVHKSEPLDPTNR